MNHIRNEMKMSAMDMSETFQATASIQLRTHPTHATINFSELGKKLLESARNGDTEDVLELINSGAPFTTDWLGASPLHYAAQYGHVDTVETLLRSGIAKDARTKIDRTALHVAAQEGFLETVNVLVNYGCDVDAKDMLKMTPLHWAVQRGHREIMEVLLNHGADVKIINKFDKTPIDIAYSTGHDDFVPLLQTFKGKAKPKVNPIDNSIPVRLMKTHPKSRSKSSNLNRNINKLSQLVKQEIDEDMGEIKHIDTYTKSVVINKRQDNNQMSNGQTIQYGNKQSISETASGKLVLNTNNTSISNLSNNQTVQNKKLFINPQNSNIFLLSNNSTGPKSDSSGPIKVMTATTTTAGGNKKPVFTEIKNTKTIQLDKFPFFNTKQGSTPQVIKRYVINSPNQNNSTIQSKDEEIRKLQDENQKLKRELEEYKSLIISKDLEIERLKKRLDYDEDK